MLQGLSAERRGEGRDSAVEEPPEWTDAHHVEHWVDGGDTSLANLVLLCRRHHRLLHEARELERRGLRRPTPAAPPREPAAPRAGPRPGAWTGPPDEEPW